MENRIRKIQADTNFQKQNKVILDELVSRYRYQQIILLLGRYFRAENEP